MLSLLAATWGPERAFAQESRKPNPFEHIRAELVADRSVYTPAQPLVVRFTLINSGDDIVDIPVTRENNDQSVTLPLSLVFGDAGEPSLSVTYNDDSTVLRPPSPIDGASGTMRLAAKSSVGVEIDLRAANKIMRYSGTHKLEWKPLGEKIAAASIELRTEPRKYAALVTDLGKLNIQLAYDTAPKNVENFLELVRDKFYDGLTFHRLVSNFIVQGGSPTTAGNGTRPDGRFVAPEFTSQPFELGTVAMALRGNGSDPNSASCQFFITLARAEELDRKYTIIGTARDEESLRTLQAINEQPTNEKDRPLRPIVIRYIHLVDVDLIAAPKIEAAIQP